MFRKHCLGNETSGSRGERFSSHVLATVSRHQDNGDSRIPVSDAGHQLQPIHVRHLQIRQYNVRTLSVDRLHRLRSTIGVNDLKHSASLQQAACNLLIDNCVINDQNDRHKFLRETVSGRD